MQVVILAVTGLLLIVSGSLMAQNPVQRQMLDRTIGRSAIQQRVGGIDRSVTTTNDELPPGTGLGSCGNVVYQHVPGLLEGVEFETLQNANTILIAALRTFDQRGSSDNALIDQQLLRNALALARHIDSVCPNGQCAQ